MCFICDSIVVKYDSPEYDHGELRLKKFGNPGTLTPS